MRRRAFSPAGSRAPGPDRSGSRPVDVLQDELDHRLVRPVQLYLELLRLGVTPGPTLERAWLMFFDAAGPIVHAAARACRGDREQQADGRQEAWREILSALPAYRHDPSRGRLCDWLFTVARRTCARTVRRQIDSSMEPMPPGADDRLEGREPAPWSALERAERRRRVRSELVALRSRAGRIEFLIVVQHWIRERPTASIASQRGLTVGQVRGHLARSVPRLRAVLDRDW